MTGLQELLYMPEETAPLEEEIRRVLGANRFGREEIEEAVQFFHDVMRHGTQPQVALKNVYMKFGVSPVSPQKKTISEIRGEERSIDIVVRVIRVFEKEIVMNGEKKVVLTGTLGDGTGSIRFTAWEKGGIPDGLKNGDVIRVTKAYSKVWRDRPELHIGRYSSVSKGSDSDLPKEILVSVEVLKIADILSSRRTATLVARVLQVETDEVEARTSDGGTAKKRVTSGILADQTGKLKFSYWRPTVELLQGDLVKLSGGYLAAWRGIPRLTLDEKDRVEKVELDFPGIEELGKARGTCLENVFSEGGAIDINVRGIAVDIKENSGLIFRCPECKRVVLKGECKVHQKVEPVPDLRVKGIIDDATGSCVFVLNKALTESILGMNLEECRREVEKGSDPSSIYARVERSVLGRPFDVRGDVTRDQFGYMLIATDVNPVSIDAALEARRMTDEWRNEDDGGERNGG